MPGSVFGSGDSEDTDTFLGSQMAETVVVGKNWGRNLEYKK